MKLTISTRPTTTAHLCRSTSYLAELVVRRTAPFPVEEHDWLTDPIRHAAQSAADRVAAARSTRGNPAAVDAHLAGAERDVAEVQTWGLIAQRHGYWSPRVADDVDRRCESILDALHALAGHARQWGMVAARRAA